VHKKHEWDAKGNYLTLGVLAIESDIQSFTITIKKLIFLFNIMKHSSPAFLRKIN
jgi:hypothetical protein